ncbi:MAG TPA: phage major capsid protein [Firmicutes bacterium]|nr:phage major capsid protein [Bacillota bacterium]
MKDYLKKIIKAKNEKAEELRTQIKDATTADEVRALGATLDTILAELQEAKDQLANIESEEADRSADEIGENNAREFKPMQTITSAKMVSGDVRNADTGINSMEYRSAFKDYVMTGKPIPEEIRDNTLTTDVSGTIPTVIVNRIISKLEEVGKIYGEVTKTSYASGVQIPVANFNVTASIVGEGEGSTPIKATTTSITFTHYKLRCEISMSMEVATMSIDAFETKFVEQVSSAMIKKIDDLIVNGTGVSQPKGILAETPEAGQALEVENLAYNTLTDAEAAVPEEYEADVKWCMNKKTFMSFIGLTDANGQPVARINYGLAGKPERTLLGRDVIITKHVKDFADGNIFAFLFNFKDYVLNTIYDMGVQRKQDWDTEDMRTKAVMSIDGKVVDKSSLVTLKKKAGG